MGLIIIQLMIIIVLTILNAFFAASEMALVSVDKVAVQVMADKGNKKAIQLSQIIERPNKFLATIQVGITLAGFFSSASAATGLASVFGELLPKRIALSNPIGIALFSVEPIKSIEEQRIHRIFEFDNIVVNKIMVPIEEVFTIDIDIDIHQFVADIASEKYSRVPVYEAFLRLQRLKKHMAIVKDKHNVVLGIVTIEDMIEEIFGNIDDEFDI